MAVDLMELLTAEAAQRIARQSDGAAYNMRVLDAVTAGYLLANQDAQLSAAVRTPTTLSSGDSLGQTAGK